MLGKNGVILPMFGTPRRLMPPLVPCPEESGSRLEIRESTSSKGLGLPLISWQTARRGRLAPPFGFANVWQNLPIFAEHWQKGEGRRRGEKG
jgi:hypothetical protein